LTFGASLGTITVEPMAGQFSHSCTNKCLLRLLPGPGGNRLRAGCTPPKWFSLQQGASHQSLWVSAHRRGCCYTRFQGIPQNFGFFKFTWKTFY